MNLTNSDWIAIIAAIAQCATTVAAVVWQVRKTGPKAVEVEGDSLPAAKKKNSFFRLFWPSLLSITIGIGGLLALFYFSQSVTKPFVALAILLSLLSSFHFIAILFFQFAFALSDKAIDTLFSILQKFREP